ncbi:MAG: 2-iminoacetate synthase ThiH [Synergistaceae bacterium]|jgi:2-iminoacetate synthase|nr:2-iminoacetate synthase ThiH [Synergistaceae bacterium]
MDPCPDEMKHNGMKHNGMEDIGTDIMDRVLSAAAAYDPARFTPGDVRAALDADECSPEDFAALLSPAAVPFLEEIAQKARLETKKRFGNSVFLFTPLYISNYCENFCVYCGFNHKNRIARSRLDGEGIEREMKAIAESGLLELLILTGESRKMSDVAYIGEACEVARRYFKVVGLEVYPMNSSEYAFLHRHGADFVTVFQETYDPERYKELHPAGRKRIFPWRFNAQERAILGGMRGVGFAALLGLADFRKDAYATGMHAYLVQRKYPQAEISLSCPRLRPVRGDSALPPTRIGVVELFQVICAYRLFMPFAGITISSRESARFRDHVVDIAATKISAGVDVGIGGRTGRASGDEQFEIDDGRSVSEIRDMLLLRSLQPVMSEYIYV